MINISRINSLIIGGLAVAVAGGIASVAVTSSAYAESNAMCKFGFVYDCKDAGGSHDGCVAAAESVCAHIPNAQPTDSLRLKSMKLKTNKKIHQTRKRTR